ncbi:MAG: glycosyltransferase family 2 protein [Oscillospiraceae bacterium]
MKISFLVTYYNQEQYVRQSLDSVLAIEKPEDWEILVGDDGSSDGTTSVVMEYIQKYPDNIFLHVMPRDPAMRYAPVQRASANRINLLEKATGDFYCILDGDDYYSDTSFVKEAIRIFGENGNIAAVMYGYKHVIDGVDGQHHTLPVEYHESIIDKGLYLNSLYTHAGACVFRKCNDIQRMHLLKSIGYFDDNDIVIYNMFFGELYCVNRVVYAYRQTGCSIYTSMSHLEQAVLNVQGYDVDSKLIDPKYVKNLLKRNAANIIKMYIWRSELRNVLGEQKYLSYLYGCESIGDSLAYKLLVWNELDRESRREVTRTVLPLLKENWRVSAKMIVKNILGM